MATFTGSGADDIYAGTESDDTIISGGGRDTLGGAGGNDTFILDAQLANGSSIDGGAGTDTIVLKNFANAPVQNSSLFPDGIAITRHNLYGIPGSLDPDQTTKLASIERIRFESDAGASLNGLLLFGFFGPYMNQIGNGQVSATAELIGGAGDDGLILVAPVGAGHTVDAPIFSYTNWHTPTRAYLEGDSVTIALSGAGIKILNGSAHQGVQRLVGSVSQDTINGSDDMDYIDGGGGLDWRYGNGGDDTLAFVNTINVTADAQGQVVNETSPTGTLAQGVFDGGDGFDFLALGGQVQFVGAVANIEGVYLMPGYANPLAPGGTVTRQDDTVVSISSAALKDMPGDLLFTGVGTIAVTLIGHADGSGYVAADQSFDGSGYTFEAGADVTFTIDGSAYDDEIVGTAANDTISGGSGDDVIDGGDGDDVIDGGTGRDVAVFSGNRIAYSVSTQGDAVVVNGPDGRDTLIGIDTFRFADGDYVWSGGALQRGISGVVVDGRLAGATVFVDLDGDGSRDAGEPSATSGVDGVFAIATTTMGVLRAAGGVDPVTHRANPLLLSAPPGSTVINPLTTMIQALVEHEGRSPTNAEADVRQAFGIDDSLSLRTFDLLNGSIDAFAIDAQKIATSLSELLAAVIGAGDPQDALALQDAALAELAGMVRAAAANDDTLDLADPLVIEAVVAAALPDLPVGEADRLVLTVETVNAAIADAAGGMDQIGSIHANRPPALTGEAATFAPATVGAPYRISVTDLLAGFTDPDGNPMFVDGLTASGGATVARSGGDYIITPAAGFSGPVELGYLVADNVGRFAFATQTVTFGGSFRLFADDGFAGEVVGRGEVFGTNDVQAISVHGGNSRIQFDASFNRGGDVIELGGDSSDYTVARTGSTAVFTLGGSSFTIPVGSEGVLIQFGNTEAELRFNASGDMLIGVQFIANAAAPLDIPASTLTPLPDDIDPDAIARLFLGAGSPVSVGGNYLVQGTNGDEEVTWLHGDLTLDASFNRGGDTLALHADAGDISAYLVGSRVMLLWGDDSASVPFGSNGMALDLTAGSQIDSREIRYEEASHTLFIGEQAITALTEATAVTLIA